MTASSPLAYEAGVDWLRVSFCWLDDDLMQPLHEAGTE